MITFHESVYICTIYILANQVTSQYAFNFAQAQVRRKVPQNSDIYLKASALNNLLIQKIYNLQREPRHNGVHHSIRNQHVNNVRRSQIDNNKELLPFHQDPVHNLAKSRYKIAPRNSIISNQHPQNEFVHRARLKEEHLDNGRIRAANVRSKFVHDHIRKESMADHHRLQAQHRQPAGIQNNDNFNQPVDYGVHQPALNPAKRNFHIDPVPEFNAKDGNSLEIRHHPRPNRKVLGIRMQRGGFGASRQTYKHFRYSRIRRYYTLSTASMTTWKKLNYTTRVMYTTPTTRTTYRFTNPPFVVSRRETVLHTRMTESDEIGRDRFMSGSIEYKDDSFDKPPTAMVVYDSRQADSKNNGTGTTVFPSDAATTTASKSTKKISSELISLESSSEEKPSSSEDKDDESSSESEDYGNEKLYGEYGYHRKHNNTPNPFTIVTYANILEVPGFSKENLTSKEVAFWEANASYILDKYFPSSELEVISNYSEENLVRSFFYHDNIEPRYLEFYKWYYKVLTDPERLRVVYNRTVLEEPDYKNLSQFTPFAIPDDLQRYYMFINQMENEIQREKVQEERIMKNQRVAEQNLDRILGDGTGDRGARAEGPNFKLARQARKKGDLDVSQILEMVDRPRDDSMMPGGDASSEGFIDVSRFKRDVSKFEPD